MEIFKENLGFITVTFNTITDSQLFRNHGHWGLRIIWKTRIRCVIRDFIRYSIDEQWNWEYCVTYCWLTHYYKLSILKQHTFIISLFLCQESGHGLSRSSVLGLTRLWSKCWLNVLIWRLTFRQEVESCPNLLRLLKELISLWLHDRGPKCFTHCWLRPLSCPRRYLHVLEITCSSRSCGLPIMDVYIIRPARRISSSGQLRWNSYIVA